nr:glutathione S-transferase T3-like [Tanacetum cinerariifolium]
MSKQNTPRNANRQQRRVIRGSPPTPNGTFDLRNTPSANQEPQRINFAPPQLVYPNQPYYHQVYGNPPFAPPQQQSAFNPYGQPNMYGHYDYGSHHNVDGSSSQPNFGSSSSQPNVGSFSSQRNFRGSSSPVQQFSLEDEYFTNLYSPRFLESFREEQSPVEEIAEFQVLVTKKKLTRRRQTAPKKRPRKEKAVDQHCIPWTPEEETALCKGWVRTSEYSVKGNMRKERGFWIDILNFCGVYANAVQMYTSGASDTDYLQMALIDYQAEYGVPFTLLHCWEFLKDSEKWNSGELLAFRQEREDGKNKRYKSSGTSSSNTKDSGEGSINLNTTVETEDENEVEEVDDPYNTQKKQEMSELLKIKNRELELKAAEVKIRRMENRQRDEALYETTTDEALKERLMQRVLFMASGGSDRDAKDALSKLLQMGTVAKYENDFKMLINRVTGISESLLTSFYISGLKVALQIKLLKARPTTLGEAFSLARITETRFEDERSASAFAKPNDLNTRVHVQDLEETTRHKPNKVEAIKSSGSSLLVESKYYTANQVGLIFNQSNEAIYYERIIELIAGQLCQYLCKHILDFGYDLQEANLQLKT